MTISDETPDGITRRMLETLLAAEVRAGRLAEVEMGEILGIGRLELDGVLKAHGVFYDMTLEDLERDLTDIDKAQNGKPV